MEKKKEEEDKVEEDKVPSTPQERSNPREFQLVVLRLFSVLMSRSKSGWQQTGSGAAGAAAAADASSNFVSSCTAGELVSAGLTGHCLAILKSLLDYWKTKG